MVWGKISRVQSAKVKGRAASTHKHRGFGGFAQPQVLESVLLVLAPLRELFHPGLAGLQGGPQRWGEAARQAHGPAPLRGLPGAAGIDAGRGAAGHRPRRVCAGRIRRWGTDLSGTFPRRAAGPKTPQPNRLPAPARTSASASEVTLPGSYVAAPTGVTTSGS